MLSSGFLLTLFFVTLVIAVLSGLIFLMPSVPVKYIRLHLTLLLLPVIVGVIGLITINGREVIGIFALDKLAWLVGAFVLALGFIIQKFSARYLLGDRNYRKYFPLYTFTTVFASIGWLSNDLRLMVICWGLTLFCLTQLIRLNRSWKVPAEAAKVSARSFIIGWVALLLAVVVFFIGTGDWVIDPSQDYDVSMSYGLKLIVDLLLVIAVIIPAAQYPFQSWLIESVVAPTPVSAIMHAGIVNAGGIILTRFSPVFDNNIALTLLLIISSISVLIGSGISLVHVDYKRQLVGSTMSQMGFMLVQCALGVYSAAIIHLILHGVFKATLFLQSGSIVKRFNIPTPPNVKRSYAWTVLGRTLAVVIAIIFFLTSSHMPYTLISAFILAWSLSVSWNQMVALNRGMMGRVIGIVMLIIVALVYVVTHEVFVNILNSVYMVTPHPPLISVIICVAILVLGSIFSIWVARRRSSIAFAKVYLWLVKIGEAKFKSVESHPNYLKNYL
ncbi:NADH dehydrogenase subunit 5 [Staphylococcus haemolyticus]|uniref:NADH dehydrogenase subunit 5 n=1 Tax=Staphylococcus haemolyticus TaxID=1283 RepID=UPI001C5F2FF2|nr:NADH dehydrogenase subunit 5 [Staphylococcus haemolyticus]MBW4892234.1 NADH dehydrogenase subunit 5 [Staphylococcus haemolyticus]